MRAIQAKNPNYRDVLARKKQRARMLAFAGILFLAVGVCGAAGYGIFFTPTFRINDVQLNGLKKVDSQEVMAKVESVLAEKKFDKLETGRNILFFDTAKASALLTAEFPALKAVKGHKKLFHAVEFELTERGPLGLWCKGQDCVYFDEDGKTWGQPGRSTGFLLLTVDDTRASESRQIDPDMLTAIKTVVETLPKTGITLKQVVIPTPFVHELKLDTSKGYPLLVSLDSDIAEQFRILGVLLNKKGKGFVPQYIDLRIDGRIYYQ